MIHSRTKQVRIWAVRTLTQETSLLTLIKSFMTEYNKIDNSIPWQTRWDGHPLRHIGRYIDIATALMPEIRVSAKPGLWSHGLYSVWGSWLRKWLSSINASVKIQSKYGSTVQSMSPVQSPEFRYCTKPWITLIPAQAAHTIGISTPALLIPSLFRALWQMQSHLTHSL